MSKCEDSADDKLSIYTLNIASILKLGVIVGLFDGPRRTVWELTHLWEPGSLCEPICDASLHL